MNNNKMIRLLFAIAALSSFSGCATMTSGTGQSVTVVTKNVMGASCELTDKKSGKWHIRFTPSSVNVQKGNGPMTVICEKYGYKTATETVDESLSGSTFGNIIFGGGIGVLVDATSGAAQQYPEKIIVWMEPEEWASEQDKITWHRNKEDYELAQKGKPKQKTIKESK